METGQATTQRPTTGPVPAPTRVLARSGDDRLVAGVCGGIGRHLGVDPTVVRLAVVVLTVANGIGLVAYLLAWAIVPGDDVATRPDPHRPRRASRAGGVAALTLGLLLLSDELGLLLPPALVWAVALSAAGFGLVWARTSESDRDRWRALTERPGGWATDSARRVVLRVIAGGALLVLGLGLLMASNDVTAAVGLLGLAMLATGVGMAILIGPWIVGLWRDLGHERRERIRSEERAEMAAHLHDSVLQTLALIQRHADAPARARTLARRQERELRAWLFDDRAPRDDGSPATLSAALDVIATEVEDQHEVEVEVVLVGDCPLDPRIEAMLRALREAAHNAARHAGVAEVSVYVEVEPADVTAFVRDRGNGFDPEAVEPGRLGIAHSIVGRMARHGGRAEVSSAPGEGTEVMLTIGRAPTPPDTGADAGREEPGEGEGEGEPEDVKL